MSSPSADYVVGDLSALLLTGDLNSNSLRSESTASANAQASSMSFSDAEDSDQSEDLENEEKSGVTYVSGPVIDSEDEEPEPEGERAKRTVFVGNLPLDLGVPKLRSMFSAFGAIESVGSGARSPIAVA